MVFLKISMISFLLTVFGAPTYEPRGHCLISKVDGDNSVDIAANIQEQDTDGDAGWADKMYCGTPLSGVQFDDELSVLGIKLESVFDSSNEYLVQSINVTDAKLVHSKLRGINYKLPQYKDVEFVTTKLGIENFHFLVDGKKVYKKTLSDKTAKCTIVYLALSPYLAPGRASSLELTLKIVGVGSKKVRVDNLVMVFDSEAKKNYIRVVESDYILSGGKATSKDDAFTANDGTSDSVVTTTSVATKSEDEGWFTWYYIAMYIAIGVCVVGILVMIYFLVK